MAGRKSQTIHFQKPLKDPDYIPSHFRITLPDAEKFTGIPKRTMSGWMRVRSPSGKILPYCAYEAVRTSATNKRLGIKVYSVDIRKLLWHFRDRVLHPKSLPNHQSYIDRWEKVKKSLEQQKELYGWLLDDSD